MDQYEASEFMIDLRDINMSWDQLITDEDELVEAGYPQPLINHWVENGMIASFSRITAVLSISIHKMYLKLPRCSSNFSLKLSMIWRPRTDLILYAAFHACAVVNILHILYFKRRNTPTVLIRNNWGVFLLL